MWWAKFSGEDELKKPGLKLCFSLIGHVRIHVTEVILGNAPYIYVSVFECYSTL